MGGLASLRFEVDAGSVNPEGTFRGEYEWAIGGTILKGTIDMTLSNGTVSGQNDDLVLAGTYTLSTPTFWN
jgi:hypothetical protein